MTLQNIELSPPVNQQLDFEVFPEIVKQADFA